MTDKKPTDNLSNKSSILSNGLSDNEIIKALEYWIKNYEGTFGNFRTLGLALDLINRQQEEIDRKDKIYIDLLKTSSERADIISSLQAENERLKNKVKKWKENYKCSQVVVGDFRQIIGEQAEQLKTAKAEAYKEFAERLKERPTADKDVQYVFELKIDNLLKELVGEDNG